MARLKATAGCHRLPAVFIHAGSPMRFEQGSKHVHIVSCAGGIPHKVNETLWRNSSDLGLRLFIPVPRDRNNGAELQSATLNLFLKPNAGKKKLRSTSFSKPNAGKKPRSTSFSKPNAGKKLGPSPQNASPPRSAAFLNSMMAEESAPDGHAQPLSKI